MVSAADRLTTGDVVTIRRTQGARGEVALRRRGTGPGAVDELIVNGAFAMDSSDASSECELARLCGPAAAGGRMLIGGLGLGYTAGGALSLPVERVDVVELEPALVRWAREGATPAFARLAADPRVSLVVADILAVLTDPADAGLPDVWDAIALDVDNGPDFLIHDENDSLYAPELLATAYARLRPGGRLAIWCQGESPQLMDRLATLAPTARAHRFDVPRGRRTFRYVIYTVDRPTDPSEGNARASE